MISVKISLVFDQLENGVSQRENKRSVPDSNDRSRQTASPSIAAGIVITETVKNG